MRVTDGMHMLIAMRSNAAAASRLDKAARAASAGARVLAPSDDPVAYAALVRRGATIATADARAQVARGAADELGIAERALDSAAELVDEARSLAVQGSNEALSAVDRGFLAVRVRALREQLIEVGNTRGTNGYLFGGTRTDAPPFDPAGTFVGNDVERRVPLSDDVAPRANPSGARAFTAAGGRDVLADLDALATALETDDVAGVRTAIDLTREAHAQIVAVQVEVGLGMDRFRIGADLLDDARLSVETGYARDSGATEAPSILTELAASSSAYEQSLEVTRRLLSLSSLAR